jgi:hypothetical protein
LTELVGESGIGDVEIFQPVTQGFKGVEILSKFQEIRTHTSIRKIGSIEEITIHGLAPV